MLGGPHAGREEAQLHDVGGAALAQALVAGQRELDRRRGDTGARPEGVEGDAVVLELGCHAEDAHGHAELGHRVSDMGPEPARAHVQRRREHQHMLIGGALQMRDAGLGRQERAARVDLVHQVIALHVGGFGAGQLDGRGVVDADVDAAEAFCGPLHGVEH